MFFKSQSGELYESFNKLDSTFESEGQSLSDPDVSKMVSKFMCT